MYSHSFVVCNSWTNIIYIYIHMLLSFIWKASEWFTEFHVGGEKAKALELMEEMLEKALNPEKEMYNALTSYIKR